jgi:hypothetical protein
MPLNPETQMTHEEEIALALKIMADGPKRDLEAGHKWLNGQRRIIVIRERNHES